MSRKSDRLELEGGNETEYLRVNVVALYTQEP